ncbi:uncharacterized protein [Drosophila pseudoobscura]|uniref:Uncharacterized protein n=1 Tax=Drosophila pseudoobscura pseudoobscura TaxID=46245 RepID=A0A6I8V1N7_DROPS|nr:uncharacterized protein LOC6896687 [Drosophila pseudoobscura]
MLNGKFYTGLPPKMVERQGAKVYNRQESHFFWPDDSQLDSAVETRVKRRNSLQLEPPRPAIQRQPSIQDAGPEVDTRRMFHKEFASSSIEFYDNLQPSKDNRPSLRRGMRREVTPKLTEVSPYRGNLPLLSAHPEEDATCERRKQAYSSTIQFYDYVNQDDCHTPTQNNARRPKMDMNDKREVELNSKNSPKLQVKRNVRSLSVEVEPKVTKKPLNDSRPEWQPESRRRPVLPLQGAPVPKRILKQAPGEDLDWMDSGLRRLQLRSPGLRKKHVTYNEQADEYAYYDDTDRDRDRDEAPLPLPTEGRRHQPTGSREHSQPQSQSEQQRSYMETSRTKPLNNYNKSIHNNSHSASSTNNNTRKILPKSSSETAGTGTGDAGDGGDAVSPDPRKHLRSSLCFNGDALIVGTQSSSSDAQARRSSARQRISVGLPD